MVKKDCEINNWVATFQKENYDWISDATASCEENYDIDDIVFTAVTKHGDKVIKQEEVKSLKGGYQFKYNGEWNDYFSIDNPEGIRKKMKFGNCPPPSMDITDIPYFWEPDNFEPEDAEMPEEWNGKHVYILNAEDKNHRIDTSKTYKVFNANACLVYVAPDGLITFSPSALRKAFMGYCWFRVKSHTEEYNKSYAPAWELKAIFDLDKGSYAKANPPKELFKK